jgi:FkbM family methyltransferase
MFKIRFFIVRCLAALLTFRACRKLVTAALFRLDVDDQDFAGETWLMTFAAKHGVRSCVDVGANVGDWTAAALHVLGSGVRFFAFEPVPSHLKLLGQRFVKDQVEIFPHAVGAGAGLIRFREDGVFSSPDPQLGTIDVQVVNRDWLVGHLPVSDKWLLKIDVEGWDDQVLAEFVAAFDTGQALVQIELGPAQRARGLSVHSYQALLPGHRAFLVSGHGLLDAGVMALIEQDNPLLNLAFVPLTWLGPHGQP